MADLYGSFGRLQLDACTRCRLCADVCPAVDASRDGELSGVYRLAAMKTIGRRENGFFQRLFRSKPPSVEELRAFADTVFRCTLCGNCEAVCPVNIGLKDLWLSLRADLVGKGTYPEPVDGILSNIESSGNVFDEENDERADWVEDLRDAPDDGYLREKAEVIYFAGCVASFFPLAQKIPMDLARIFDASGVDFSLLGEEEWCCGFPLLGAGLQDSLEDLITHNIRAVEAKGAKEVVFACPGCFHMWQTQYPATVKLSHSTQFLLELIEEGRAPLKPLSINVTYHDPCDLGRASHVYEAPRRIIKAIPGITLTEMERNRDNCLCCGGGGNLEMIDPKLSGKIAELKVEQVLETGADMVVTACQQCIRTMTAQIRHRKLDVEVIDITELVRRSMDA